MVEAKLILTSAVPRLHPQFLVPGEWKANFGEVMGLGKRRNVGAAIKIKMNN